MKTKQLSHIKLFYLFFSSSIMIPNWLNAQQKFDKQSPVVQSQITQIVKTDIRYQWSPKEKVALGEIASQNNGQEPNLFVIGGRIAAGYQNGGLYRQSQQTAYPNLVAIQMGLKNFNSPLFDIPEGNGTGYKILKETKPYPILQEVTNNLAFTNDKKEILKPFQGTFSNYAIPDVDFITMGQPLEYMKNNGVLTANERIRFAKFADRLFKDKQNDNLVKIAKESKADFAILEVGIEDYLNQLTEGRNVTLMPILARETHNDFEIIKSFSGKGVIINVPDLLDFPFFHFYSYDKLSALYGKKELYAHYYNINTTNISPKALFLPTKNTDALFRGQSERGLSFGNPLEDEDILTEEELITPEIYNSKLANYAKSQKLALVDLYSLYKKILSGEYRSADGLLIDPNYETGNFFSVDGLTPTAIGQAVIANEIIKVLNAQYGSLIPLINLTEMSKTLSNR